MPLTPFTIFQCPSNTENTCIQNLETEAMYWYMTNKDRSIDRSSSGYCVRFCHSKPCSSRPVTWLHRLHAALRFLVESPAHCSTSRGQCCMQSIV
jgi:hypothetical protein